MWELDHKEGWALKNWCFWTVVLKKTLESPLDCKIKPVNPKGNQPCMFIGRTDSEASIFWPSAAKRQFTGKDPDAGKDWRQEEKGTTEVCWLGIKPRSAAWKAAMFIIIPPITELYQFSSVTQSCLTLCDPMNSSTPGLPVHHKLLEKQLIQNW